MCCLAPPLVMGGRWSPKLQLQFLHLPCLQETEFPTSSDGVPQNYNCSFYIFPVYRKRNFVEGMCCFAPPLVMGGRRSPKLQLQFFTFALFTRNGILWKECVVLPHL
ncbi:hypothetical protein TNCV_4633421 [Trichonephila clavipes]|nr:hypothetical protein TNCV_4633421 [Trichonephila clavipes]